MWRDYESHSRDDSDSAWCDGRRPATNPRRNPELISDRWNWMVDWWFCQKISFCHSEFAGIKNEIRKTDMFLNIQRFPGIKLSSFGTAYFILKHAKLLQNMLTSKTDDTDPLFAFFWEQLFEPERVRTNPRIFWLFLCLPSSETGWCYKVSRPRVGPWKTYPPSGVEKNERRGVHFCHVSADFEW